MAAAERAAIFIAFWADSSLFLLIFAQSQINNEGSNKASPHCKFLLPL